jgi:hypothetical protein
MAGKMKKRERRKWELIELRMNQGEQFSDRSKWRS